MDNTRVTVLIPTYNRKENLEATLKALSEQENENFNIVISDNCSNYSIEKEILTYLPPKFKDRIKVHHHRFNIGGTANILGLLGLCETEYGWMLGDDDCVQPGAIENIYSAVEKYPSASVLWFLLGDRFKEDWLINNMKELNEFLCELNNRGDFIFCSNKVYKIPAISAYMDMTYRYTYTRISQCFPMMESLKRNEQIGIIGEKHLIEHGGFPEGITWDVGKTVLGLKTIIDYPTGLKWEEHCRFVRSIMFSPKDIFNWYIDSTVLPWNYKSYLKSVYHGCYQYCYPLHKRLGIKIAYWIASCPVGWRLFKTLKNVREKLNRIYKGSK